MLVGSLRREIAGRASWNAARSRWNVGPIRCPCRAADGSSSVFPPPPPPRGRKSRLGGWIGSSGNSGIRDLLRLRRCQPILPKLKPLRDDGFPRPLAEAEHCTSPYVTTAFFRFSIA